MKMRDRCCFNFILAVLLATMLVSCASPTRGTIPFEVTPEEYAKSSGQKGVVLVSIDWGRKWKCGQFENAELLDLGFDRLPLKPVPQGATPELFLDGPPRLTKRRGYQNYALLVPPGEYALTSFRVKAAKSISDVGVFSADRTHLVPDGQVKSGTFRVDPGEVVYIGHFHLDCYAEPIPWRYYIQDRAGFNEYLQEAKSAHPYMDVTKAQYRLFRTKDFGIDFQLSD